ncbi:WD40 repeat-like protein [Aureobasidium sp. EXF-10727]|nr:WD40 repeat-like protein [Aureobasidium sp. EXF-10727]
MSQRGRVVIDLSDDSPPSSQSIRHMQQPVPDSRFITPSDESGDDDVEILWNTRKQRNDKDTSNTLKSNAPPVPSRPTIQKPHHAPNNHTKKSASQIPSASRPSPARVGAARPPQQSPARVVTTRPSQQPLAQPRTTQASAPDAIAPRPPPFVPTQPLYNNNPVSITNPATRQFLASLSKSRTPTPLTANSTPIHQSSATPLRPSPLVPTSRPQLSKSPRPLPNQHAYAPRPNAPLPVNARDTMGSTASQPVRPTHSTRPSQPSAPTSNFLAPPVNASSPLESPLNAPSRAVSKAAFEERNNGRDHLVLPQPKKVPPSVPPSFGNNTAIKSRPPSIAATSFSHTLPKPQTAPEPRKEPAASCASPKMPPSVISPRALHMQQQSLPQQKSVQHTTIIEIESSSEEDSVDAAAAVASPRSLGHDSSSDSPRAGKRKLVELDDEEPVKRVRSTRLSAVSRPPIETPSQDDAFGSVEDDVVGSVEDDQEPFTFPADISKIPPFSNRYGQPFTLEEDALIVHLKEVAGIQWKGFEHFFPGRKWPSMQTRYSKVLSKRNGRPIAAALHSQPATRKELPHPTRELRRKTQTQTDSVDSFSSSQEEVVEEVDDSARCRRSVRPLNYLVRHRELGSTRGREWPRKFQASVKDLVYSSMGAHAYMDDGSGDVSTIAWSPDGKSFAAGAVAVTDRHSVDYNKPRNLVVGNVATQTIKELPDHTIKRTMPDGRRKELFSTVQMVAFSPDSRYMYSAGIDRHLHKYRINGSPHDTTLVHKVEHPASVDFLSIANSGLVATGCASSDPGSIKVFAYDNDILTGSVGLSGTAQSKKTPSALRWGAAHQHHNYLLAGFSREAEVVYAEDDGRDKEGEVALWDVNTQQRIETDAPNRNVFDLAWNPNPSGDSSIFAVASRPISHVSHGIHSVVRLYSPQQTRAQHTMELDCPAWDINDVVYSPHDNNLIAVGSTEGRVYIWDVRYAKRGQSPLNTLKHGESLAIMPHERKRWEVDTGIRFLSWGTERDRLYTGSSDGVVACWDPYRGDSDKHVRDVVRLNSAVMSGAFSPDFSHLLVGEDAARLNLLSVGHDRAKFDRTTARFSVEKAPLQDEPAPDVWDCERMLSTQALETKPAGTMPFRQIVQGPNYTGPYRPDDDEAARLRDDAQKFQERLLRSLRRRKKQTRKYGMQTTEVCGLDCGFIPLPDDYVPEDPWLSQRMPDQIRKRAETECFRCGEMAIISPKARIIECRSCGTSWRIGALGYEVIEQVKASVTGNRAGEEGGADSSLVDLCDSEDERERFVRELSTGSSESEMGPR